MVTRYVDSYDTDPLGSRVAAFGTGWSHNATVLALQNSNSGAVAVFAVQTGAAFAPYVDISTDVTIAEDFQGRRHVGLFLQSSAAGSGINGYRIANLDGYWLFSRYFDNVENHDNDFSVLGSAPLVVGRTYRFRVVHDSSRGIGFLTVDGEHALTWRDSAFAQLRPGFFSYGTRTTFDNLVYLDGFTLPSVGLAHDALYARLPQHHREADAAAAADFPLYRWLGGIGRELSKVADIIDGIDYVTTQDGGAAGDTSTLADPTVAPVAWLPWLAQLVSVPLRGDMSEMEKRDAIRFASAGWRAGTKSAVADAARTALTGTRFARVYDHSITQPGDGGEFDVLIVTRSSETPDVAAVLATVVRRAAKPAGVVLRHRAYESSWDTVTASYPTWNDLEAAGSWDRIQEAGL